MARELHGLHSGIEGSNKEVMLSIDIALSSLHTTVYTADYTILTTSARVGWAATASLYSVHLEEAEVKASQTRLA
jgi:hypothetical protein